MGSYRERNVDVGYVGDILFAWFLDLVVNRCHLESIWYRPLLNGLLNHYVVLSLTFIELQYQLFFVYSTNFGYIFHAFPLCNIAFLHNFIILLCTFLLLWPEVYLCWIFMLFIGPVWLSFSWLNKTSEVTNVFKLQNDTLRFILTLKLYLSLLLFCLFIQWH